MLAHERGCVLERPVVPPNRPGNGGTLAPIATSRLAVCWRRGGYSFKDQAISELTAPGAPVRPLMLAAMTAHGLLLIAFAVGIWRSAGHNRSLRWVEPLLIASSIVGFHPGGLPDELPVDAAELHRHHAHHRDGRVEPLRLPSSNGVAHPGVGREETGLPCDPAEAFSPLPGRSSAGPPITAKLPIHCLEPVAWRGSWWAPAAARL